MCKLRLLINSFKTMNTAKTISVNPGVKTVGAIFEEALRYQNECHGVTNNTVAYTMYDNLLTFLLGIPRGCKRALSMRLLIVRLLVCSILFAAYFTGFVANFAVSTQIATIIVAISILTGTMMRVTSLFATVVFLGTALTTAVYGCFMSDAFIAGVLALCTFFVAVVGPGLFSVDQIIRFLVNQQIRRNLRKAEIRRRTQTYRAYWH
jgi:uncharacterized membrane protein YphA (DoxX/SURF4 family)